jgi:hypothetical protein
MPWILSLLLALLLSGCGISTKGLIPDPPLKPARHIDKTVKIMPVQGGHESKFGREAYITNEQYHEVLSQTLKDSGIFTNVVESDGADLNLYSEIVTITTESGVSPLYAIVVQYWIIDPKTDEELWSKGINSRHQVKWNEAFAGATRIIKAVEGATKKNLIQLVEALAASDL